MSKVVFTYKNGKDRRMARGYAEVLAKLGHGTYNTRALKRDPEENIDELRLEYKELFGKRPFHGWSAEELREKISGASE